MLKVYKWNDDKNNITITNICTNIRLYQSHKNISSQLEFTIAYEWDNYYFFNFELGDKVCLWYNGAKVFEGKITDSDFSLSKNTHTFTCNDLSWWLINNEITVVFENPSVKTAIFEVFDKIEFRNNWSWNEELGDNANILIGNHIIEKQNADKVLMAIMQEVSKQTGIYYYIHMDINGRVIITECDKYYSGITIQKSSKDKVDGNLIDYQVLRSIKDVVNQIKIYDQEHKLRQTITANNLDARQFGIIQDTVVLDEEENYDPEVNSDNENKEVLKAQNKLEKTGFPSEDVVVTCIGDVNYKVGYGVMVKLPHSSFYDKFMYITASEWTWIPNSDKFISKLTLSSSKHKDLTDFVDIEVKNNEENDSTGDENGGQLVQDILAELKKHLGVPYKWGGKTPETGMDCSGYIAYVYNKFASQLEITSDNGALSSCTYPMMNEGKDVTSSFPDNLRPCDIIFPNADHVCAYIGNGQVIHSPHTGDVIKIRDNYSSAVKVIRVVPDSAFESKKGNVSKDGSLDGAVNCTSQKEFASIVAVYCKELYKEYHIFPGTIIACMIQESWTGSGFTKLAKNHYNFGGVKCSASSPNAVHDYKPPASEGSMLYRNFASVKDFMIYWCELISGRTGMSVYKTNIADKNTPRDQIFGFDNTPYAGDKTKGTQMWAIYKQNNLEQYDSGL